MKLLFGALLVADANESLRSGAWESLESSRAKHYANLGGAVAPLPPPVALSRFDATATYFLFKPFLRYKIYNANSHCEQPQLHTYINETFRFESRMKNAEKCTPCDQRQSQC